jgi:hypothetical protein
MTPIYHITHFDNLSTVLREGGLVCDAESAQRALCQRSIAHANIKERRATTFVVRRNGSPAGAGGMLADYVPFYFAVRSPMLYAIHKGAVTGYTGGQAKVVYLVSSAEAVAQTQLAWCFTDGHAVEGMTEFYGSLADLAKVDQVAIQTWRWGGKWLLNDPDVKRRKQAEFLIHKRFPWELVSEIGVYEGGIREEVANLLDSVAHRPSVAIRKNWYYDT